MVAITNALGLTIAKVASYVVVALLAIRYAGGIYAWHTENRLEQPAYEVVMRLPGGVEVRRYESYNIAEATIKAGLKEATSSGFQLVAGYIFGKNVPRDKARFLRPPPPPEVSEKMAMTAPVRQAISRDRTVRLSFVMSPKRSLGSLPIPRDAKVRLRQVPPHYAALVKFSGPPPADSVVAKKKEQVLEALAASGGTVRAAHDGETLVHGFHDPFVVPNFLRRNEVGVNVVGPGLPPKQQ